MVLVSPARLEIPRSRTWISFRPRAHLLSTTAPLFDASSSFLSLDGWEDGLFPARPAISPVSELFALVAGIPTKVMM